MKRCFANQPVTILFVKLKNAIGGQTKVSGLPAGFEGSHTPSNPKRVLPSISEGDSGGDHFATMVFPTRLQHRAVPYFFARPHPVFVHAMFVNTSVKK